MIDALVPTLTVATANAPIPPRCTSTMPLFAIVAASATMSGVGVLEDVRASVLTPGITPTGSVFVQSKAKRMSVPPNTWLAGVSESTKDWP